MKVYLAGPIRGLNYEGATEWRETLARELDRYGHVPVSPMRGKEWLKTTGETIHEAYEDHPISSTAGIYGRDTFDIAMCDALLAYLLEAETVSLGTVMEIQLARDLGKYVLVVMQHGIEPHLARDDAAWLAGLIDGDGSLIIVRPGGSLANAHLRIAIEMTDRVAIERAREIAGCGATSTRGALGFGKKQRWSWMVASQQAARLIPDLYPHLIVKRQQAALGWAMMQTHSSHYGGGRPIPDDVMAARATLWDSFGRAQRGEVITDLPLVPALQNPHDHPFVRRAASLVVETMDAALQVLGILGAPYASHKPKGRIDVHEE